MRLFVVAIWLSLVACVNSSASENTHYFGYSSESELIQAIEEYLKENDTNKTLKSSNKQIYRNNRLKYELALYYAGFPKEVFSVSIASKDIFFDITNTHYKNLMFYRKGKIRDFNKALFYAKSFCEGPKKSFSFHDSKNDIFYLTTFLELDSGEKKLTYSLKDWIFNRDKERKILLQKLEKLIAENEKILKKYDSDSIEYKVVKDRIKALKETCFYAHYVGLEKDFHIGARNIYLYEIYAYFYGIGGIQKDLEKVKYYVFLSHQDSWKFFFSGYLVPQDIGLALYILESQNNDSARNYMKLINSGFYNNAENASKIYHPLQ